MRIKMIGHACLLCETEDTRILMDPWIVGPSNFRSWWHIPEIRLDLSSLPKLDYIYISHLHADHFHVPTLKLLDRRATVIVPRLYHRRMVENLRELGYTRIMELPHGKEVQLSPATRATCLQMGNDSLLAVADSSSSMLNGNDCLQGNDPSVTLPALRELGNRYRFDIAFLAFGTAGPFPKCYRFEDRPKGMDPWIKERAMLKTFVEGAVSSGAPKVVPFAGGFALLAEKLMWMNDVKTTPIDAREALQKEAPHLTSFEMNPGDVWDNHAGLQTIHPPVEWSRRLEMIRQLQQDNSTELARIEAEERQGPHDLYDVFQKRLTQNMANFPFLRKRMNCSVLFDVQGEPGGLWEVDLRKPANWFSQGDSGEWLMKVTIPSALLAEVLADPGGWETLGISYKLDLYMKKGGRMKEAALARLLYTPSPFWLLRVIMSPRVADFAFRRRTEFLHFVRRKLTATA